MKFTGEVVFLGAEKRKSKKTYKEYIMAKLYDLRTLTLYDMYVSHQDLKLYTTVAQCKQLQKVCATFEMKKFKDQEKLELVSVEL